MGLFDKLKPNKNNKDFFEWLDLILKNELNSEIKAINFNLYEDTDNKWSVELVGTFSFDKDNDDWACDEVFTTRDHPFVIECESDWELVETFFIGLVNEYLSSGKYAGKLTEQPVFSETEKQEINLIMAYIKECGTYAKKFYSGKISENSVDMEKLAYVNDNLYDRICDKIGRLHKENGEPMPYEKNDNIVR